MNFEICLEITEAVYFHWIKFCTFTRMLLRKTKSHNDDIVSLLLIETEYQRKLRFDAIIYTNILFYSHFSIDFNLIRDRKMDGNQHRSFVRITSPFY